jgi:hypothetical protein
LPCKNLLLSSLGAGIVISCNHWYIQLFNFLNFFIYSKKGSCAGGMAQVVGHLPSKCEALSSNPTTTKKKKKKKEFNCVAQAELLDSELKQFSHFSLSSAGTTGMYHHTVL